MLAKQISAGHDLLLLKRRPSACRTGPLPKTNKRGAIRPQRRPKNMTAIEHPSVEERIARGKAARERVAPSGHSGWVPAAGRPDPVALLEEQNATREADLVPVRHGRMLVSPFTFYRGAAKIMASDLKDTPTAGLEVQLCGDAHLSNFGVFASPERDLLFDLNDFDETLPGPFEYDVKRMAASFAIAARNNGFAKSDARATTLASVKAYREAMGEFAQMGTLDIWYAHLSEEELLEAIKQAASAAGQDGQGRQEASREDGREGAHPGQLAGIVEVGRGRGRPIPDRQSAADRGPAAGFGPQHRALGGGDGGLDPRPVPRLSQDVAGRSP